MGLLLKQEIDLGNGLTLPQIYLKYRDITFTGKHHISLTVDFFVSPEASYNDIKPFHSEKIDFTTDGLDYSVNFWAFIHALIKNKYPDAIDITEDPTTKNVEIKSCIQVDKDIIIKGKCEKGSDIVVYCYGYKVFTHISEKESFEIVIENSVDNFRYSLRRLCFKAKSKNKKESDVTIVEVQNFNDPEYLAHENAITIPFDKRITKSV